jgi:hypothetical protein
VPGFPVELSRPADTYCQRIEYLRHFQSLCCYFLCEDLQRTEVKGARIEPGKMDIDKLHWTLHFLYCYPTQLDCTNVWNKCSNTVHDSCWFYTARIRALKATKIYWPCRGFWKDDNIWVVSANGTHLLTLEPGDSDTPKYPSYFSFKHHADGFNYVVGICLFKEVDLVEWSS